MSTSIEVSDASVNEHAQLEWMLKTKYPEAPEIFFRQYEAVSDAFAPGFKRQWSSADSLRRVKKRNMAGPKYTQTKKKVDAVRSSLTKRLPVALLPNQTTAMYLLQKFPEFSRLPEAPLASLAPVASPVTVPLLFLACLLQCSFIFVHMLAVLFSVSACDGKVADADAAPATLLRKIKLATPEVDKEGIKTASWFTDDGALVADGRGGSEKGANKKLSFCFWISRSDFFFPLFHPVSPNKPYEASKRFAEKKKAAAAAKGVRSEANIPIDLSFI